LKGHYTSPAAANIAIASWRGSKGAVEEEVALLKKEDESKKAVAK